MPKRDDGTIPYIGKLGKELTIDQGYAAAKLCALNCLAAVKLVTDSLDDIEQIVRVRGFVNSAPDFYDQPKVVHGASEFLIEVLGERGRHVRTAVGVAALPGNVAVEVDMLIKLKESVEGHG